MPQRNVLRSCLFLILLGSVTSNTCRGNGSVWEHTLVLEDTAGQYTIEDVLRLPDSKFTRPTDPDFSYTNQHVTYVRYEAAGGGYLLFYRVPDVVSLYRSSRLIAKCGGDVPYAERAYPDDFHVLPLPAQPGTVHFQFSRSHIRFRKFRARASQAIFCPNEATLKAELGSYQAGRRSYHQGQLAFLGTVLLLLILILIPYLIWREASFGAYLCYIGAVFLFYLFRRTLIFEEPLWYLRSSIKYAFEPLWIPVIVYTYSRFVRSFLAPLHPVDDRLLLQLLRLIEYCAVFILGVTVCLVLTTDLYIANIFGVISRLVVVAASVPVIVLVARRKDRFSRILSLGVAAVVAGMLLLIVNDVIKRSGYASVRLEFEGISNFQLGFLAELLLYWCGLWYKMYEINKSGLSDQDNVRTKNRLALLELQLHHANDDDDILLSTASKQYKWPRTQVLRFVAERETTRIFFNDGRERMLPLGIGEVERQLPGDFSRVHRSHIVRAAAVERYDGGRRRELRLTDGTRVPVGRVYQEAVRKSFG